MGTKEMNEFYLGAYLYGRPLFKRRTTARPDKRNGQTCLTCGRKGVNTYNRGGVWRCRLCWEERGSGQDQ